MPLATPPPASRGELHSRPSMLQLLSASPPPPFLEATGPHRQSLLPSPSPKCHRFSTAEPPRRQAPSTVSPHRCELARRHPLAPPPPPCSPWRPTVEPACGDRAGRPGLPRPLWSLDWANSAHYYAVVLNSFSNCLN
jgi:hypothetical protein